MVEKLDLYKGLHTKAKRPRIKLRAISKNDTAGFQPLPPPRAAP